MSGPATEPVQYILYTGRHLATTLKKACQSKKRETIPFFHRLNRSRPLTNVDPPVMHRRSYVSSFCKNV